MFRFFPLIILIYLTSCISQNKTKIVYYNSTSLSKTFFTNNGIVLVGGCFDLIHYGHVRFLQQAKAQGKYLIVALESDESITNYKKRKPIHNQLQRAEILSSFLFVDKVLLLPELEGFDDYAQLVQNICPSVIAVTKFDPQLKSKQKQAKLVNAKVIEVIELLQKPNIGTFSSTNIIKNTLKYK